MPSARLGKPSFPFEKGFSIKRRLGRLKKIRILSIVGSPRLNGNTHFLTQKFAEGARKNDAEVLSLPAQEVVTTKIVMEKGLGIGDLNRIEVLGEKI